MNLTKIKVNRHKLLNLAEEWFCIFYLILYSGGILVVILSDGISEGDGRQAPPGYPLLQLAFLLNYFIAFCLLTWRWKTVLHHLLRAKLIVLLVAFASCSFLWSAQPSESFSKIISLIGTTLFGTYIATRFSIQKQLKLLLTAFGIIVILSFLFAIALPKYGIMGGVHAGAWRGIYNHKNNFAQMLVLAALVFLCNLFQKHINFKHVAVPALGFFTSLLLLLLARSTSGLLISANVISLFFLIQPLRWRDKVMIPSLSFFSAIAYVTVLTIVVNVETILGWFGKDLSLTGRSDIWPIVIRVIQSRLWLGYGYGGFWGDESSPGGIVWREYGWEAPNAHNGFLDLWAQLGLVGLILFVILLGQILVKTTLLIRHLEFSACSWLLTYSALTMFTNVTETALMINNSLTWILFTSNAISVLSFKLPSAPKKAIYSIPNAQSPMMSKKYD